MATTRSICPLDLKHILQYCITGPGCSGEKYQLLNLLKERFMNKVAVAKTKATFLTFPRFVKVHFTVAKHSRGSVCMRLASLYHLSIISFNLEGKDCVLSCFKITNKQENRSLTSVFLFSCFAPCFSAVHMLQ